MDITVAKDQLESGNYFERHARVKLQKYFNNYPFLESIKVFFRGKDHKYKKVKLKARLKGKDIFVEARGDKHDVALDNAADKLYTLVEKYKSKHYKRA